MSNRYKMFEYEITDNPEFMDREFGIAPEIKELVPELHHEMQDNWRGVVE